jgi:hypothetical protein
MVLLAQQIQEAALVAVVLLVAVVMAVRELLYFVIQIQEQLLLALD